MTKYETWKQADDQINRKMDEDARKRKDQDMEKTIDLTPNYKVIFKHMLNDGVRQAEGRCLFADLLGPQQVYALREVQRFFAPLAVAVNAITSQEELEIFRSAMADIIADINQARENLEMEE